MQKTTKRVIVALSSVIEHYYNRTSDCFKLPRRNFNAWLDRIIIIKNEIWKYKKVDIEFILRYLKFIARDYCLDVVISFALLIITICSMIRIESSRCKFSSCKWISFSTNEPHQVHDLLKIQTYNEFFNFSSRFYDSVYSKKRVSSWSGVIVLHYVEKFGNYQQGGKKITRGMKLMYDKEPTNSTVGKNSR